MENLTENSQGFMIKKIKTNGVENTIDGTLEVTETSIFEELGNWVTNPSCDLEIISTCKLSFNLEGYRAGEIMPELPMVFPERNGNSIVDTFYDENNTKKHHPNPIFVINNLGMRSSYSLSTDSGAYHFLRELNGYQTDWRSLDRFSILLYFPWFGLLKTEKAKITFIKKMRSITRRLFQILTNPVEMANFLVNFPEPEENKTRNLNIYTTYFKDRCFLFGDTLDITERLDDWAGKRYEYRDLRVTRIVRSNHEMEKVLRKTRVRFQLFNFTIFKDSGIIKYNELVEQCEYAREPLIIYIDFLNSVRSCDVDNPFKEAISSICKILAKYNLASLDNCWFFLHYNEFGGDVKSEESLHSRTSRTTEKFYKFLCKAQETKWYKENMHIEPKKAVLIDDCFMVNEEGEWATKDLDHFTKIINNYSHNGLMRKFSMLQVMRVYTKGIFHKFITTGRAKWRSEGVEITKIKFSKFSKDPYKVERFTTIPDDRKESGKGIFVIEIIGHSLYNQDPKQIAEKIVAFLESNPETKFNYFMSGCCIVLCIDRKCVKTDTGIKQMDKTTADIVKEIYQCMIPKMEFSKEKYFDQMIKFAELRKREGKTTEFSLKDILHSKDSGVNSFTTLAYQLDKKDN